MRLSHARMSRLEAVDPKSPFEPVCWQALDPVDVGRDEQEFIGRRLRGAVPEGPASGLVLGLTRRPEQDQAHDRDLGDVHARRDRDRLQELVAHEGKLGRGERERHVDPDPPGVGADPARVAQAAELGHAARDGGRVVRAGLDVAGGLAEAVGRAERAVGDGLEACGGRVGP